MDVPTCPELGVRLVMLGGRTVKLTALLGTPPTVTTTLPVVVIGTETVRLVELQLLAVAETPLKVTVLVPWVVPKLVPVIVTEAPICPLEGLRELIVGVGGTVKDTPLLATPPTVTMTLPVVAPTGTGTVIPVALQLEGVAAVPLKVTVLVP